MKKTKQKKCLIKNVEILCKNYGPIGGFWFDRAWDKKDTDWQKDCLCSTTRRYQPTAVIINNTGLSKTGKTGHRELDSVTFEQGKPKAVTSAAQLGWVTEALFRF